MKKTIKKLLSLVMALTLVGAVLAGCSNSSSGGGDSSGGNSGTTEQKTYFYVAAGLGESYSYDMIIGLKHAAAQYGCKIVPMGANDWDSKVANEALEGAVAQKPDGIITAAWDTGMNPGIEKAMAAGIPVVLVEAHSGNEGNLYIGLDNVDAGRETADTLISLAGESGKLLVMGNWGSTNIDDKFVGLKEVLADHPGWEIVGDEDGDCEAETSLRVAKDLINNHPEATAFVGLDSACGAAIGTAMEELGMDPGSLTVVCADREDAMFDYIRKGYVDASLTNRTAAMCYMAVEFLESVTNHDFLNVPVTGDNAGSGVSPFPLHVFTGNVIINKDNVDNFDHANLKMEDYDTPLYG